MLYIFSKYVFEMALVIPVIFLCEQLTYQIILINVVIVVKMVLIGSLMPFKNKWSNVRELLNISFLALYNISTRCLTDYVSSP
jgi:hypothetical protein